MRWQRQAAARRGVRPGLRSSWRAAAGRSARDAASACGAACSELGVGGLAKGRGGFGEAVPRVEGDRKQWAAASGRRSGVEAKLRRWGG
jgi:hypothetical protein